MSAWLRLKDPLLHMSRLAELAERSRVVIRDGVTVFHDETTTNRMKRTTPDLVSYLGRDNAFPEGVFLITGTGIVPPDEFKLEPDDIVEVTIEGIGTLRNPVIQGSPVLGSGQPHRAGSTRGCRVSG